MTETDLAAHVLRKSIEAEHKAPKTKQGVRNLDALLHTKSPGSGHTHRLMPHTFTNRSRVQVTVMKCYCGETRGETAEEVRAREEARADAEADGYWMQG